MKQIIKLELPYTPDSATLFASLKDQEWPIWLDSGNGFHGHHLDIMAANPTARLIYDPLKTSKSKTALYDNIKTAFAALESTLKENQHQQNYGPGWIGFISYDLYDQFEAIEKKDKKDLIPQMVLGFYGYTLVNDHNIKETYILSLPECEKEARILSEAIRSKSCKNALPKKHHNEQSFKMLSSFTPTTDRESYIEQFSKVKRYILQGDCYQVNLTQQFKAQCTGEGIEAYLTLRSRHSSPMSTYFKTDDFEILSLSPERFVRVENQQICTQPIKGTRPRHPNPEIDQSLLTQLKNSEKDLAENVMIVDLLRNDLGRLCENGSITTENLFAIESYPNVHHLVSTVNGKLRNDLTLNEIFRAIFPGGSITGAPKVRAMQIIEELEPHRRSIYCGSVVYIGGNGLIDSNIAIRTLLKTGDDIYCWGGGGIVADSDCDKEYQETWDKVGTLMGILEEQFS